MAASSPCLPLEVSVYVVLVSEYIYVYALIDMPMYTYLTLPVLVLTYLEIDLIFANLRLWSVLTNLTRCYTS